MRQLPFLSFDPETKMMRLGEGNHRVRALKELGYTHVPVLSSLTPVYPTDEGATSISEGRFSGHDIQGRPNSKHVPANLPARKWFPEEFKKLFILSEEQPELSIAPKSGITDISEFSNKKIKFPSVGKALGVAGAASDIADITSGDLVEGALGLGSNVLGRAAPYSGILRPEKTVSEELESRQMQEAKERMESEDEAKYKREALKRLMSKMEE